MADAAKYLRPNPNLPDGKPKLLSQMFGDFTHDLQLLDTLIRIEGVDQWELMYQKLLEAKDCAVRAVLDL